ncbi:MAG: hypothetical protein R6U25_06085 [Alkalispirochaeta sp.]
MRYSGLFTKTLTQVPKSIKAPSYRLLMQAGFVRPVSQGLFSITPLGMRVMRNLKRMLHEEMQALGGQEVLTPLVNPREMWKDETWPGKSTAGRHPRSPATP